MEDGIVTVLGGTGFVGRCLAQSWPDDAGISLRILVHRSRPSWLEGRGTDVRSIDLSDERSFEGALVGSRVLVDLLRPQGDGQIEAGLSRLLPVLSVVGVEKLVHASSIDVYGAAAARYVTEETPVVPRTPYEREHRAIELAFAATAQPATVLRLGAVFGEGSRNLAVLADEMASAPAWRLGLRRALYGRRRLHLVSVESVAEAVRFAALSPTTDSCRYLLVTDDAVEENNFAFVQDRLAATFGRTLPRPPEMPAVMLRLAMKLKGRSSTDPYRRFSSKRLTDLGFRPQWSFVDRLERFCAVLAAERGVVL